MGAASVMKWAALAALLVAGSAGAQEGFPHEAHDGLFPLCEGCHPVDDRRPATLYPDPEQCAACHDGEQARTVAWRPPTGEPAYRHPDHEQAAGVPLRCERCHDGGATTVLASLPAACESCHEAHHAADARCRLCHAPAGPLHDVQVHRGCAECHYSAWIDDLEFGRELCLVCHREMAEHQPGRRCGRCHLVGAAEP